MFGVRDFDEDLELLLLGEELHLDFRGLHFLRSAELRDEGLDTALYRLRLHLIFVQSLYVELKNIRRRFPFYYP